MEQGGEVSEAKGGDVIVVCLQHTQNPEVCGRKRLLKIAR